MEKKSCNVRVYFQETLREKQPSLSRGHSTQTHLTKGTRQSIWIFRLNFRSNLLKSLHVKTKSCLLFQSLNCFFQWRFNFKEQFWVQKYFNDFLTWNHTVLMSPYLFEPESHPSRNIFCLHVPLTGW